MSSAAVARLLAMKGCNGSIILNNLAIPYLFATISNDKWKNYILATRRNIVAKIIP